MHNYIIQKGFTGLRRAENREGGGGMEQGTEREKGEGGTAFL